MRADSPASDLLRRVLDSSRPGILTDIDGTISSIAPSPDTAFVDPAAQDALRELSKRLTLTGTVTGRTAEDARKLVGLDELVYSGNHGMELWRNGELQRSPLAQRHEPEITRVLEVLESTLQFEGMLIENKILTASIHYRAVADPESVEAAILAELERLIAPGALKVTHGRKVIEIRPPVELSKGTSVAELAAEYQLDGLIYLGDDVTDVDAFRALSKIRAEKRLEFYSVGVRNDPTPQEVIDDSDAMVDGVDGVVELLQLALQQLNQTEA